MASSRSNTVLLPPVTPVDRERNGAPAAEVAAVSPLMVAPVRAGSPAARQAIPTGPINPTSQAVQTTAPARPAMAPAAAPAAAPEVITPSASPAVSAASWAQSTGLVPPVTSTPSRPALAFEVETQETRTIELDGRSDFPITPPVIYRPAPTASQAGPVPQPISTPAPLPVTASAATPMLTQAETWLASCGCQVTLPVGYPASKKYGQVRHPNCPEGLGWPTAGQPGAHLLRRL